VLGAQRFGGRADIDSDRDGAIETGASFHSANFDYTGDQIQTTCQRACQKEAQFGSNLSPNLGPNLGPLVNSEQGLAR
jgi:hypothetical protein